MKIKILLLLATTIIYPLIESSTYAQSVITIDHKTQRFIDSVSIFEHSKYATTHFLLKNADSEFDAFKSDYNIDPNYKGSRQFWNPFGTVKNGVIPTVKSKYSGVREVEPLLVATGGAGSLLYDDNVDYSTEDVSEFSKQAAEFVAKNYRDEWELVPEFIEPFNEPMVHAHEYYPEGKNGTYVRSKTDSIVKKICEYHRDLGKAIHALPELVNMKVLGFASAYPEFENNDFDTWNARYKSFIDIAGADVDVLSLHLYDGSGINNSGGRRSGSNSEAILDIIETYSYKKFQTVKPIAVTEYGRLVPNQPGWTSGGDISNYEAVENSQAVRSQIHLAMNFMERADNMEITIPFNVDTRDTSSQYTKSSIWIDNGTGTVELTQRRYLYEILKDLKGDRVRINSSNIDIQTQAFVNDKQLFVVLNNLNDNTQSVNLGLLDNEGLQSVDIKRLKIFLDKIPELTNTTESAAPANLSLDYGETVVLTYNFDSPITFENKIYSKKYYTAEYLKSITANVDNAFNFDNVEVGNGFATLRLSVGRAHGLSLEPTVTVNGNKIDTKGDIIRGYDQSTRKQFFGTLEIPVSMSLLKEGTNSVNVKFSDAGGRISSVILQVQKSEKPIEFVSGAKSNISTQLLALQPNIVNSGDLVRISTTKHNPNLKVYTLTGTEVYQGTENTINTSGFKAGVYIVTVKTDGATLSSKLVVK